MNSAIILSGGRGKRMGASVSKQFIEVKGRPIKYETGAALGLIMDKLNIDWKYDIEDSPNKNGETQYEILKKYFNISDKDVSDNIMKKIEEENNSFTLSCASI